jgi:hypothetical protein
MSSDRVGNVFSYTGCSRGVFSAVAKTMKHFALVRNAESFFGSIGPTIWRTAL